MAILASGHKLVRCGIDGAISGVVTDETLSGNGTSGKPLGALLEDVLFDDSITESSTDFGTLIGVNPLWVNYVVTGGGSSGGNPQVNYIVNTYSGAWNNTTDVVQSNSSNWDNVTNKLDTTSFSTVSGNFLTAVDLTPYYTTADANTLSSMFSGAIDYVSSNAGIDFPASADNAVQYVQSTSGVINETTNVVQSNSAQWAEGGTGDVEVNSFVYDNSATINEVNTTFQNNSGKYLTAHQSLAGYATQDWVTAQGYITGVDLSNYYTKNDTSSKSEINAALTSITPGDVGVNSYVQNNSATINNVNTTYQSNSGHYLTAHQDISNKLDTNSFTAWSAAQAANAFKLSAGNGINLIDDSINKITRIDVTASEGDIGVNTYVRNNSAGINNAVSTYQSNSAKYLTAVSIPQSSTWNDVASTYQTASSTYLTAHQDISNKLDITAFRSWTATQEANDYELSAGIGVTLYDDTVNKITRIDANGSNFLTIYSKNEGQNSAVLGLYHLYDGASAIQGIVQFVPNGNGTFALCPFTAENNNAYYSSLSYQCTNSPTVNSGDLVTLPFHFYADGQFVCPSVLGIKGSNSTATITPYNIIINYK